ncbi:hypothetical protein KEM56_001295 [Ascosphaera pollenicola]|nr:hypothetical protein KEM56_001295 [Ascosphaera pollenicola]
MGRRNYLNMLALGRSPYELPEPVSDVLLSTSGLLSSSQSHESPCVQEYDSRGRPTNARSKAREKHLRRAKNDILSTMGIVVNSRNADADASMTLRIKKALLLTENEAGFVVDILSDLATAILTWRICAYDRRLQASYAYDITELWSQQLSAFALLHTLNIIPTNSLPSLLTLVPFTSSTLIPYPKLPQSLNIADLRHFIGEAITFPLVIGSLVTFAHPLLKREIRQALWYFLPKPDRPDNLSVEAAEELELSELRINKFEKAPTLPLFVLKAKTWLEGLRKHLSWKTALSWIGWRHTSIEVKHRGISCCTHGLRSSRHAFDGYEDYLRRLQTNYSGEMMPTSQDAHAPHSMQVPAVPEDTQISQQQWALSDEVNDTTAIMDIQSQFIGQPPAGDLGTEETSITPHDSTPTPGLASPLSRHPDNCPTCACRPAPIVYHHLSTLSIGPADRLSSYLSSMIATLLIRPLNTIWIRRILHSYLLSCTDMSVEAIRAEYQLRSVEAWFGGYTLHNKLLYVSKTILVLGTQWLLNLAVWKLVTNGAVLVGNEKFRWGNL